MIRNIHRLFFYSAITLLVVFAFQLYSFIVRLSNDEQQAVCRVQAEMESARETFGSRLGELMKVADAIALKITNDQLDSVQIHQMLEQKMKENPDVFGLGVGFEPNQFNKSRALFAPFYIRPEGEIQLQFIEDSYDYTKEEWYTRPLHNGAAWFDPPYFGEVAQTMMAEYSVPFYRANDQGDRVPIGIVFLDYSLEDITKAVSGLDLGKSGYGLMFSRSGVMVAHPQAEKVHSQQTIADFADEWQKDKVRHLFDSLEVGGKPFVQAVNKESEISCRIFFKEIEQCGWRLGAVFIEDAFKTDSQYVNRVIINLTSCVVGMCLLMFLFFLYKFDFKGQVLTRLVPFLVIVFLLAIAGIWFSKLYQPYNIFQQKSSYPVADPVGLQKFLANQDSLRSYYHESDIVQIPTGVFLKHIQFDGSHNVRLSGMVWQKYNAKSQEMGMKPDLLFMATAPDAEAQDIREVFRKKEKDGLVVGWHFRVEVREKMHYGLYPLDRERVSLRIDHPDMSKNIQLIPDLGAYDKVIATELPGIDGEIILPEWETEQSYFDFQQHNYNTSFGVLSPVDRDYKYDLGFNVILKRKFLWPTMANIIPLATITILLFLALVSTARGSTEKTGVLFSGFGLLELCAAFLFVAILTHIDLRSNLIVNYIMYMDYFYFHVYFTIIICSLSAVLLNKDSDKKKMAAVRLLYWPALLGSLFVFTALRFY